MRISRHASTGGVAFSVRLFCAAHLMLLRPRPLRSPTGARLPPLPQERQNLPHHPVYRPVGLQGPYLYSSYAIRPRRVRLWRQSSRGRTCRRSQRRAARFPHNPSGHPQYTYMKTEARNRYPKAAPPFLRKLDTARQGIPHRPCVLVYLDREFPNALGRPTNQVHLSNTLVKKNRGGNDVASIPYSRC